MPYAACCRYRSLGLRAGKVHVTLAKLYRKSWQSPGRIYPVFYCLSRLLQAATCSCSSSKVTHRLTLVTGIWQPLLVLGGAEGKRRTAAMQRQPDKTDCHSLLKTEGITKLKGKMLV